MVQKRKKTLSDFPSGRISALPKKLRSLYGDPAGQWLFWCKRPKTLVEKERIIIESILTQRTNWKNVRAAMDNLQNAKITTLTNILHTPREELESYCRPSGFFRQKTERLLSISRTLIERYGKIKAIEKEETFALRNILLSIKGVGFETADDILLYAFERPVFVIDEYTRRTAEDLGINRNLPYETMRNIFEEALPRDWRLYQDFHALLVIHGKEKKG
ncbi:MAG: endonuclease [Candidatus Ratteibacteria bacterium]